MVAEVSSVAEGQRHISSTGSRGSEPQMEPAVGG